MMYISHKKNNQLKHFLKFWLKCQQALLNSSIFLSKQLMELLIVFLSSKVNKGFILVKNFKNVVYNTHILIRHPPFHHGI